MSSEGASAVYLSFMCGAFEGARVHCQEDMGEISNERQRAGKRRKNLICYLMWCFNIVSLFVSLRLWENTAEQRK